MDVGCMQDEEEDPFDSVVLDQIRNGCISSVELDSLFTSVIQSQSQDVVESVVESSPKMIYLNPALEKENQDLEAPAVSSRKQEAATTGHTSNPTKKQLELEDSLCSTTTPSKAAATIKPLLN